MITIIAAQDENGIIGSNGKLPWDCPNDEAWFHQMTMGHPVIMGRKTWEESHDKKHLEGRLNIVVTSQDMPRYKDRCIFTNDINKAIRYANTNSPNVFIIGGAEIYEAFLPLADRIFLTTIHSEYEGDTKFPEFVKSEWERVWRAHATGKPIMTFSNELLPPYYPSQTYEILIRKGK